MCTKFSSSSFYFALPHFKFGIGFSHNRYPFYSVQSHCYSSFYTHILVHFNICHPSTLIQVFLFYSLLVICLPVTSILSFLHPISQHNTTQHNQATPVYVLWLQLQQPVIQIYCQFTGSFLFNSNHFPMSARIRFSRISFPMSLRFS